MDIDSFLRDPLSRRRFFGLSGVSVAGGAAVLLTACGDGPDGERGGGAKGDEADVELLNSALDLELMTVAAYKAAAPMLKGSALDLGQKFLEQEQEHADGLTSAIEGMGGTPNQAKSAYEFPRLRSQRDALRFAVDLERTAVAAYLDALPKLADADARATAAAIVTNEAEHIAVLHGALDRPQVPSAFVTGRAA